MKVNLWDSWTIGAFSNLVFVNPTSASTASPKRGGFMPPVPLPRRMFGGFRTTYHKPLILGEMMRKEATIKAMQIKSGQTGTLVICTVRNRLSGESDLAIEEEHDFVYRDNSPKDAKKGYGNSGKTAVAPEDLEFSREITLDPVMLFRYSACTFNSHRIHYDYKYVTEVEGYPGLIEHGPLIATFLMELSLANNPDGKVRSYIFQAHSPLFENNSFTVAGKPLGDRLALWSITPDGRISATGAVRFT
jgi:3-methylfumaryl-CoA hydratase